MSFRKFYTRFSNLKFYGLFWRSLVRSPLIQDLLDEFIWERWINPNKWKIMIMAGHMKLQLYNTFVIKFSVAMGWHTWRFSSYFWHSMNFYLRRGNNLILLLIKFGFMPNMPIYLLLMVIDRWCNLYIG